MSTVLVDRSSLTISTFNGVRGYEKEGVAYLHIEDVARGLGFTEQKDGVEYVRWRTVDSYLSNLAFATSCENGNPHDYYIPENIFYRLCMKAKNAVAEAFQAKVADEIIPSIRKTGSYNSTAVLPQDYETALIALLEKVRENKRLEAERDKAIKTKYQFVEGRDAKVCGELGGLRTQNENLRKQIGISKTWKQVKAIEWLPVYFNLKLGNRLFNIVGQHLSKLSRSMQYEVKAVPDIQWGKVNAYHIDIIDAFRVRVHENPNYLKEYRV